MNVFEVVINVLLWYEAQLGKTISKTGNTVEIKIEEII
jgi:hypothetical protein